jgi:TRAP-type mannitol/chloroaromatic compound transport system permease large subunit
LVPAVCTGKIGATVAHPREFFEGLLHQCIQKIEETATAQVLAAVPLFIFMGAMFEQSGIANRLFDAI